jgi:hypothetical protein
MIYASHALQVARDATLQVFARNVGMVICYLGAIQQPQDVLNVLLIVKHVSSQVLTVNRVF